MLWLCLSLMMTQAEEQQVTPIVDPSLEPPVHVSTTLSDDIRVSGLLYTSPDQWVVWVNGHKMRPQSLDGDGFHVQKVEASCVTLSLSDQPNKTFELSPGERLNRTTGQVVD